MYKIFIELPLWVLMNFRLWVNIEELISACRSLTDLVYGWSKDYGNETNPTVTPTDNQ